MHRILSEHQLDLMKNIGTKNAETNNKAILVICLGLAKAMIL